MGKVRGYIVGSGEGNKSVRVGAFAFEVAWLRKQN